MSLSREKRRTLCSGKPGCSKISVDGYPETKLAGFVFVPMSTASLPTGLSSERENLPVVIQTRGLSKAYRTGFWLNQKVTSLKDCSLTIYEGETFGLLGPNGAGKTTLLKTLLGIIRPTTGKAQLLGRPLGEQSVKQRIGYLPENPYFYDFLTGWEFLQYTAGLFGLSPAARQRRR